MAIITFLSDFGTSDYYVASVKARILRINPSINVVDISHEINAHDLAHAAFTLKAIYKDFPPNTVHFVAVDSQGKGRDKLVAVKMDDHYFIGADNGIFSLINEKNRMPIAVELSVDKSQISSFPEKNILAEFAAKLASGTSIHDLGNPLLDGLNKKLNPQISITPDSILGHVIHTDNYGNVVTNIHVSEFLKLKNGRSYEVTFGRETLDLIFKSYNSTEGGDIAAVFNSLGLLEIAVIYGNAAQLLGLSYDSPVTINFL